MTATIEEGDKRIDRASQRILRGLLGYESRTTSELCEVADLAQNNQVIYRMEEHLKPAGLVEEMPRATRWGSSSGARQFVLSKTGSRWISEHEEEMGRVVTVEEMRVGVGEAVEAAESVRSSVQNYRRKVSRLKQRVEEAEETVEKAETVARREAARDETARDQAQRAWDRAGSVSTSVKYAQEEIDRVDDRVDDVVRTGEDVEKRLTGVERKLEGVIRQQAEAERARGRGLLGRLLGG